MEKKALNATSMKLLNQNKILKTLISCECSRAELARKIGLTRSAISIIVDELIDKNIIIEGEPILGKIGRKSFVLKINPNRYYIAGINLARDKHHLGFINFSGETLYDYEFPSDSDPNIILKKMKELILDTINQATFPGTLLGIGITAPGPIDSKNGIILNPPNFEQWLNTNIFTHFQEIFSCPIILENNANALALAEKYYGIGNCFKSYVQLSVDTGIGCGSILENKLYKGSSGFGNDFGHMSINFLGELCNCGNRGCSELYASIPNIVHYAKHLDESLSSWEKIVDLAISNDPLAQKVVNQEAMYLSTIITNIVNILDVDAIIMSSTINYKGHYINSIIERKVNSAFFSRLNKQIKIVSSSISLHAPILSAANLIIEHYVSLT